MKPPPDRLPDPDADARAHSAAVLSAVRAAISGHGGWITFAQYMQSVLYAPALGYYVAGARKFGAAGDFVTAPELTRLFGIACARQVGEVLAATGSREIVELGAGSGRLAADLMAGLAAHHQLPQRYVIVEISPELRERQRATLAAAPMAADLVEWRNDLPDAIDGAIVMNEVLDAIPAHVVARRSGRWYERGVAIDGEQLRLADRELSGPLAELARDRFPPDGDYLSEINPAAEALVEDVGRRLRGGAMLVFDYGFPRAELYHPQRATGTLMGHYRHRAHGDPFLWPGLSDLTTHIDFTAIAEAGERAGLAVAGYTTQAAFLLGCGLLERLAECGAADSVSYLREASAVQTLTSPAEMGELFKVLALARSEDIRWPGFELSDQSHRL